MILFVKYEHINLHEFVNRSTRVIEIFKDENKLFILK